MNPETTQNIAYSDNYIAFLDVLGFKELVMKDNVQNRKKLNQYFEILNTIVEYIRCIEMKKDIGFIVISDSIIMSIPQGITKEERMTSLRSLCVAVGLIQYQLALIDIWLRGGIASGKAYFNKEKNQIVGPAYINAYILEEKMAIYPRVLLDSKIINELDFSSARELIDALNQTHQGGMHYSNWGSAILYNWTDPNGTPVNLRQDVALFIDYFCPLIEKPDDLGEIIKNIQKNIYNEVYIYSKFRWVSDYIRSIVLRDNIPIDSKQWGQITDI